MILTTRNQNSARASCRINGLSLFAALNRPLCATASFCSFLEHSIRQQCHTKIFLDPEALFSDLFPSWNNPLVGPRRQIPTLIKLWKETLSIHPAKTTPNSIAMNSLVPLSTSEFSSSDVNLFLTKIRSEILLSNPVILDIPLYASHINSLSTGFFSIPKDNEKPLCRHLVLVDGFDDSFPTENSEPGALFIRNCWGREWGEHGFGVVPYSMLQVKPLSKVNIIKTKARRECRIPL